MRRFPALPHPAGRLREHDVAAGTQRLGVRYVVGAGVEHDDIGSETG